jgi:putative oxidoreductase
MRENQTTNRAAGMFFLRALLGVIVGMQGFGKIYTYGIWVIYNNSFQPLETVFPKWWLIAVLFFTTFTELIAGICLVFGVFRAWALYLLAAVILIVSFGHGIDLPIWDLQHVMPRAILIAALLLLPTEWDTWKLSNLRK